MTSEEYVISLPLGTLILAGRHFFDIFFTSSIFRSVMSFRIRETRSSLASEQVYCCSKILQIFESKTALHFGSLTTAMGTLANNIFRE